MLAFLGGDAALSRRLLATGRERSLCLPGCCCFRPWRNGKRFVHRCTVGVYQYVLLKVICSVAVLISEATGSYEEGSFNPSHAYFWIAITVNISQCYALFILGLFYVNTRQWLAPLSPIYKFGIVKLIVFVLFWQSVAIAAAGVFGFIEPFWSYHDVETAAAGLQDFVITIELFIFAVMYHYYYSYTDFYSADPAAITPLMQLQLGMATLDAAESLASSKTAGTSGDGAQGGAGPEAGGGEGAAAVTPTATSPGSAGRAAPAPAKLSAALYDIMPVDVRRESWRTRSDHAPIPTAPPHPSCLAPSAAYARHPHAAAHRLWCAAQVAEAARCRLGTQGGGDGGGGAGSGCLAGRRRRGGRRGRRWGQCRRSRPRRARAAAATPRSLEPRRRRGGRRCGALAEEVNCVLD